MKRITFGELVSVGEQQMRADSKSQKTIDNSKSILRKHIIVASGCTEDSVIGDQFNGHFSAYVDKAEQASLANPRVARSALNKWRDIYYSIQSSQGLPEPFDEALQFLVDKHGLIWPENSKWAGKLNLTRLSQEVGVSNITLRDWYYGKSRPAIRSQDNVRKIEKYFGLADDTLVSKCYGFGLYKDRRSTGEKVNRTKYALRIAELTEETADEINELLEFKTALFVPSGMKRIDKWDLVDPKNYGGQKLPFAYFKGKFTPTGQMVISHILRFFGYLHTAKAVPISEISLALISDCDAIRGFFDFLQERRGRPTTNISKAGITFAGLLNPDGGYVAQTPSLARRHPGHILEGDWSKHCGVEREKLLKLLDGAKSSISQGRNPDLKIAAILKSPEPMRYLHLLDERMGQDKPHHSAFKSLCRWHRDRLLLRLMSTNPLRINQFKTMTWRPDNTGDLRLGDDGEWRLFFEASRFKNRDELKGKLYSARVPEWAAELIPGYLEDIRPLLLGAKESDYVFIKIENGINRAKIDPTAGPEQYLVRNMHMRITELTNRYLGDIVPGGFGPHAFRYIVATHLLKVYKSIDLAAAMLHDKPETVRNRYGQLYTEDAIAVMSDITSDWRAK